MPLAQVFFEVFGCVPSGQIIVFELIFGRCLRPGLLRARFARLLLRNELNPAYPYRIFEVEV